MPRKASPAAANLQRPPAEVTYADELKQLKKADESAPRPGGWQLTPQSVIKFILGDPSQNICPKFIGSRSQIERCIVALATNRGLMLIGEPGTAKSYLSELLAAAISGDSSLTIQGSAGTTEDTIKYSWNYALLLAEGPSQQSLVPAPLYRGLSSGKLVRFEEITRCPLEIQDTLLSILSDRVMSIPELPDRDRSLYATLGFNLIATANTRDRGVNEMSAALKRRFNFETIQPITSLQQEMQLVQQETDRLLAKAAIPISLSPDLTQVLVTTFRDLRTGTTAEGHSLEPLSTVMSTAEAVSVGYAAALHAYYYQGGQIRAEHLLQSLMGSALKGEPTDLKKLQHYFSHIVAGKPGPIWQECYSAYQQLL
ncbi:MAG: AAA family ATPase [Leptolyngbya sp. SIOISBB]|nr:AAA family ATPase [Leptolyngbya sp. SIOISBB]